MKLLVVGDIGIIFTYEYIMEIALKFPGCKVDVLSFAPRKEANAEREKNLIAHGCNIFYQPQYKLFKMHRILHIFIRLFEFLRYRVCRKYDVINIHFPGADSPAVCCHARKSARVVTSIYGSDVLRSGKRSLDAIEKLLVRSDTVTVANDCIKAKVSALFASRFDEKTEIVRYGSIAAAAIGETIARYAKAECKECFGFPKDRITVLCGYNGSRAQRHKEIIGEIVKLPEELRNKIYLVLQCSYGFDEAYGKELAEALAESKLDGEIVTEFMKGETLAKFRKSMDVFLNLQPTDVLSATMIEELESGTVVVKGDWLSYPDLEERNVYMRSIPDMKDLSSEMEIILENYSEEQQKAQVNRGIGEILSWEKQYDKWKKIIID